MAVLLLALAPGPPPASDLEPDELKTMPLEQLADIEVALVSLRPERPAEAASAIHVITARGVNRVFADTRLTLVYGRTVCLSRCGGVIRNMPLEYRGIPGGLAARLSCRS